MLTQIYNKGCTANSRSGDKFRQFEYNLLFQVCYWEHKNYNWSICYGGLFYQLTRLRAGFDLMTVIISDKAALFVSLFVYHGGRLSMLLPVAYMQTE